MFCVRCGKEATLHEALCAECFRETQTLVRMPAIVRVEVCALCGARYRGGSWGAPLKSPVPAILEEARSKLDVDRRVTTWDLRLEGGEHDPTNYEYDAVVTGRAVDLDFEARSKVTVHVQKSTCTRCGRRSGGYYESIVQLRAQDRDLTKADRERAGVVIDRVLDSLRDAGDLDSYLTKVKEERGGPDFYMGTVSAGRAIAKALSQDLGAVVRESATLVTRDKTGLDVYRVTFSTKLPRASIGGFVGLGERLYQVTGMSSKTATIVDLLDHRRHVRPRQDLDKAEVLDPAEAKEAVVVSATPRELQVLDPESLRTVDLPLPEGFGPPGEAVRVVHWGERLWVLPPEAQRAARGAPGPAGR